MNLKRNLKKNKVIIGIFIPLSLLSCATSLQSQTESKSSLTFNTETYTTELAQVDGKTISNKYTGKATSRIVDLKASVRYLRYNDKSMPGNAEKIISMVLDKTYYYA